MPHPTTPRWLCLSLLLCLTFSLPAQDRPTYVTTRLTGEAPKVDGLLDDAAWNQVPWGRNFYQGEPDDTAPPADSSAFKIIYDDRFLYVAMRAYDREPEKIVARMGRRDEFPGDFLEVNFDSRNDDITGFSFTGSASGVRGDEAISQDGQNWDPNWNPYWFCKTNIDSLGYTVEAKIPFSQLRFSKNEEQEWGLQINRAHFRTQQRHNWARIRQNQPGFVSRFGTLKGLSGIKARKPLELQPYVLGQVRTGGQFDAADPFNRRVDERLSAGLDGRIGITNDIAVDFTLNPDFGQVEADPGAINLDGFQIFFREQRPFFVENRDIFEVEGLGSDLLFYSRRIGGSPSNFVAEDPENGVYVRQPENTTILGAAKVSGKTPSQLSIGLLSTVTEREFATIRDLNGESQVEVEPLTFYNVGRVRQDFNDGASTIGGILTHVERNLQTADLDYLHNRAVSGGVDLLHRWNDRKWELRASFLGSQVQGSEDAILRTQTSFERLFQRPGASHLSIDSTRTALSGTGASFRLAEVDGNWRFGVNGSFRSPGLELNDIGFLNSTDNIGSSAYVNRRWVQGMENWTNINTELSARADWDFSGRALGQSFGYGLFALDKQFRSYNFFANFEVNDLSVNALRGGPVIRRPAGFFLGINYSSDQRKDFRYGGGIRGGGGYDGNVQGRSVDLFVSWRASDAFIVNVSPEYSVNQRYDQYVTTVIDEMSGTPRYVHGFIDRQTLSLTVRATYNLTPDFTVQYYAQPFIARGVYREFKDVADPLARQFNDRYTVFQDEIYDAETNTYLIIGPGGFEGNFRIRNPDFNFVQFRSNLVVRWEYRPSSTLFLVWSQGATGGADPGRNAFATLTTDLFEQEVRNTFLVKATYRWVR